MQHNDTRYQYVSCLVTMHTVPQYHKTLCLLECEQPQEKRISRKKKRSTKTFSKVDMSSPVPATGLWLSANDSRLNQCTDQSGCNSQNAVCYSQSCDNGLMPGDPAYQQYVFAFPCSQAIPGSQGCDGFGRCSASGGPTNIPPQPAPCQSPRPSTVVVPTSPDAVPTGVAPVIPVQNTGLLSLLGGPNNAASAPIEPLSPGAQWISRIGNIGQSVLSAFNV